MIKLRINMLGIGWFSLIQGETEMWNIIAVVLVLGLTAFALMQVFSIYGSASDESTKQMISSTISNTISVIKTAYSLNPDFTGFNNTIAKQIGAVPVAWTGNGPFNIPTGGTVSFNAASVGGQANAGYSMTFTGISPKICMALAGLTIPQMVSIQIGTNQPIRNPAYDSSATGNWPPTIATISSQCSGLQTNQSVILTLK